jgi:thioredoxin reductase
MARGAIPGVSGAMADVLVVGAGPVGLTMAAPTRRT